MTAPTPASIADLVRRILEACNALEKLAELVAGPDPEGVLEPKTMRSKILDERDALRAKLDALRAMMAEAIDPKYAEQGDSAKAVRLLMDRISALRIQLAEQEHFHRVNRDGFVAMTKRAQELESELARLHRELYGTEGELQSRVSALEDENRQLALDLQAAEARAAGACVSERGRLLAWATERKAAETDNRPDVNIHKKTLVETWNQVLRFLGAQP
jgi:chromosome segregation ATPase